MWKRLNVNGYEKAILIQKGQVTGLLHAGKHTYFDPRGNTQFELHNVNSAEFRSVWLNAIYANHSEKFSKDLEFIQTSANEIAIVTFKGAVPILIGPSELRAFWKSMFTMEIERVDVTALTPVPKHRISALTRARADIEVQKIDSHTRGLLYFNGEFIGPLAPGRHAYWKVLNDVSIKIADMREQQLEVTAQEILTQDRVSLRVTLSAVWKIVDAAKAFERTQNVSDRLYKQVQFAIRDAVAGRTLDELLNVRDALDTEIMTDVANAMAEADLGVSLLSLGVKDIILPGDMREILNRVVAAEKEAQANAIRRREETASTRSLLNTARLMADNPILLRMKEMETLETLTEKIGKIDFHAGQGAGLESLLTQLVSLKPKEG